MKDDGKPYKMDAVRKLKIKSGVVRRITREYFSYQQEVNKDKQRINNLKESGSTEAAIRRQEAVLEETVKMIPDAKRRLQAAFNDLKDYMKDHDTTQEVIDSEFWGEALECLSRAENEVLIA